jgi:hypothetical protein
MVVAKLTLNPRYEDNGKGDRLVVLSEQEFKSLTSFASKGAELSESVRQLEHLVWELNAKDSGRLPAEVTDLRLQGEGLVRAIRR